MRNIVTLLVVLFLLNGTLFAQDSKVTKVVKAIEATLKENYDRKESSQVEKIPIMLDNKVITYDSLNVLSMDDIAKIEILTNPNILVYGTASRYGIIQLYRKPEKEKTKK